MSETYRILCSLGEHFLRRFITALFARDGHFLALLLSTIWGLKGGFTSLSVQGIFGSGKTYCARHHRPQPTHSPYRQTEPPLFSQLPRTLATSFETRLRALMLNTPVFSLKTSPNPPLSMFSQLIAAASFKLVLLSSACLPHKAAFSAIFASPTPTSLPL